MIDFKDSQFAREIILWGVRWYVAYPISYRQLEEMMDERGVTVDHSTLNRWVIKYAPEFEKQFHHRQWEMGLFVSCSTAIRSLEMVATPRMRHED
jgi:transposase-like protein